MHKVPKRVRNFFDVSLLQCHIYQVSFLLTIGCILVRQACQFSDHDCWVIQLLAATRCNPCFNYEIKDSRESFTKASSANWKEADIEY
ncbi:hypothetical protein ES332_A10G113700v1 [Gossypium tomentosum]|nr:hypothetical protein ES332_A10G113700v1 [Gossypium tomentosum]